tara:strand:+ start:848 stop:1798 length:951 start_codon:yes stop_codon:yes gene_type:complete
LKNLLIIGLGRLGVRHLQGMLNSGIAAHIYCIDIYKRSIEDAKEKASEVSHGSELIYSPELPEGKQIDLAIIATNSSERFDLSKKLLESNEVRHLILEKVVFTNPNEYSTFSKLLKTQNTACYVNHVRRLFPHYQKLKDQLQTTVPIYGSVSGSGWGLASNTLHFIDLFQFLTGSIAIEINTKGLKDFFPAKRKGYDEISGLLEVKFANNSTLFIYCGEADFNGISIHLSQNNQQFFINEGLSNIMKSSEVSEIETIRSFMVTETTAQITKELLNTDSCQLPKFNNIKDTHELFVSTLFDMYSNTTNTANEKLKIT